MSPLPEPISDPYAAWRLTQEYGLTEYAKAHPEIYKGCGGIHPGRDYAMASGTPVAAPWDGVIVNDRVSAAYGVCCRIRDTHDYLHLLGHLKSVVLSVGSSVVRGELVALSDNTGTSNGAHLHWEVRENGKWFNPLVWVERMNQEANKVTDAEFESWWRMLKPDAEYNPTFGIETAVRQAMERGEVKAPPLSNEYNYPGNRDWNVRHFGNGQTAVYSKSKNVVSWM